MLKPLPFIRLLPNVVTLLALSIGLSSIRYALENMWERAICCILFAGLLDALDGRIARLLNATSPFGVELDSLCDFANFGVAPSLLIYLWSLQNFTWQLIAWGAVLLYVSCIVIRLARFNIVAHKFKQEKISMYFFVGVPAPLGALLVLVPIMLDFELAKFCNISIRCYEGFIISYLVIIGILTASRLPTFSIKNLRVRPEYIWLCLISMVIFIVLLILYPWYLLPLVALLYIFSIIPSSLIARRITC